MYPGISYRLCYRIRLSSIRWDFRAQLPKGDPLKIDDTRNRNRRGWVISRNYSRNGTAAEPSIPPSAGNIVLDDLKRPLEFTVSRLLDFICIALATVPVRSLCFVTWVFLRVRSTQKSHKIAPTGSIWISIIRRGTDCLFTWSSQSCNCV